MFKKIGVVAIAAAAAFFLLKSTHLGAYARTAWDKARTSAQKQIPLEFQLDAIRGEVAQLMPDMRRHISQVAAETVAVSNLREEITTIRASLDQRKDVIRTMSNDLKKSETIPVSLQKKLTRDVQTAKVCAESLKLKEAMLEAREKSLEVARVQLDNMRNQKSTLEVQIAQIETELKTLRLAQTKSEFHLDDSRLAFIKSSLSNVRDQMQVQRVEAAMMGDFELDQKATVEGTTKTKADLVKEVRDLLGDDDFASVVTPPKK